MLPVKGFRVPEGFSIQGGEGGHVVEAAEGFSGVAAEGFFIQRDKAGGEGGGVAEGVESAEGFGGEVAREGFFIHGDVGLVVAGVEAAEAAAEGFFAWRSRM